MPERFGGFWVVHTCFSRWSPSEVWEKVFHPLAEDSDKEYAIINTEIVRAHQHNAGGEDSYAEQEDIGLSIGGFCTLPILPKLLREKLGLKPRP